MTKPRAGSRLPKEPKERFRSHFLGKKSRVLELAPTVGSQSQTSNFGSFGNRLPKKSAPSQKSRKEPKKLLFFLGATPLFFLGADMELAPCRGSQSQSWLTIFGIREPALGFMQASWTIYNFGHSSRILHNFLITAIWFGQSYFQNF